MASRMNEFREFVALHPLLRDEVKSGKRTWQNVYEDWVIYGDNNTIWNNYKKQEEKASPTLGDMFNMEKIKNVVGMVKKIDTNQINKTLNNVQKIIQIVQSIGTNKGVSISGTNAFSDWWD